VNTAEFLGLEQRNEHTWSLRVNERVMTPGRFLFGGCALAAGVVALEAASGRPTVWATAQYLSYAPEGAEVLVTTELAVVGGHVTQARATATVDDTAVLTVNAALGTGSLTAPPWTVRPPVAAPLDCPKRNLPGWYQNSIFDHLETRLALGRRFTQIDGTPGSPVTALWARIPGHLDPSAATMAILGDFVSGGAMDPLGRRTRSRSLDNTIRIATLEPTEWVLCEIHMHALTGGFAQGTAFLWSESGTLLATASQSLATKLWEAP